MFEQIAEKLLTLVLGGGPQAIIAILLLIIGLLWVERSRLVSEIKKKDEKIDKIVSDYYKGNLTISEALNSLKMVLYSIREKI